MNLYILLTNIEFLPFWRCRSAARSMNCCLKPCKELGIMIDSIAYAKNSCDRPEQSSFWNIYLITISGHIQSYDETCLKIRQIRNIS